MPIKINLLAEAQAAEELRRKDPVKRAIWAGALVILALLMWSAVLYSQSYAARSEQARLDQQWKANEKEFNELTKHKQTIAEFNKKMAALDRYYTNRFLWGSALNAFQQCIPTSLTNKIQFVRLNGFHEYQFTDAVPAKKKSGGGTEPAKPAISRERITIVIDARDYGNPSEQNFDKLKSAIASVPFFRELLPVDAILLKGVTPPVTDLAEQKQYVQFTLECKLPPVERHE